MPWQHCDVPFILDDEVCPACGADKGSWTVQVDKTRTLVIGLPKRKKALIDVELRDPRGNPRPARPYRAEFASGLVKTGALDKRAQARFEQLAPGPCRVTFPEDDAALERGARFDLARPLAEALRAAPAPAPLWKLERVAAISQPALQAVVAAALLPPPAAPPSPAPPVDGQPLKAEVPLRATFAGPGEAQAWLRATRLQVHVDGQQVPCGAYVAPDPAAPGRVLVRVQFRVPPGSHHVTVSTRATARGGVLRTVLLSQRLEVEGGGAPAGPGPGAGPTVVPMQLALPAAGGAPQPSASKAEQPAVTKAQPMSVQPAALKAQPLAASPIAAEAQPTAAQPAASKAQPVSVQPAALKAQPIAASPAANKAQPAATKAGGVGAFAAPGKQAKPGPYAAFAAGGGKLIDKTFAPEPIGLTRDQIERGAGERYVFQPETSGLEAALPLRVTFASPAEAQRWLRSQRLQVHVDGQAVACGAFVAARDRVVVQFRVEPGDHHVAVSTRATARGQVLRTVLLSQRLAVEADVAGGGPPAAPPPAQTPSPTQAKLVVAAGPALQAKKPM
ncbi:MAG: hypothetical protein M9894_25675 [Planctomycetes bacterium]|nr:hypothetical protein [Planctomycetota bacterium]